MPTWHTGHEVCGLRQAHETASGNKRDKYSLMIDMICSSYHRHVQMFANKMTPKIDIVYGAVTAANHSPPTSPPTDTLAACKQQHVGSQCHACILTSIFAPSCKRGKKLSGHHNVYNAPAFRQSGELIFQRIEIFAFAPGYNAEFKNKKKLLKTCS